MSGSNWLLVNPSDLDDFLPGHAFRKACRGHRIEGIGNGYYPCFKRNMFCCYLVGIALPSYHS
jgi:hypothetical protein